ncbi:TPA: D-alanine--D-alanine ligase [Candidatus Scatousia excrementigallinarum]|uniref:D-alanine--D-alanine ligase n=1 Tax=Candidatus Scatousia excrementigallinarum TaxID=2840935 RepID=A0A9D1EXT7_9BACT|nr:D-alanine--D-alanine ligase [Candidatus Scatousia excrementigallinarum]
MQEIKNDMINKNAKIAVLCGGMSSEAEISMRSGKGCYDALKRLGFNNAELVVVDKNIAETLKNGKYDYAFNALHGKYGEDGCIQGLLEILQIPYTGCGVMASSLCMNKEFTKRILSTCKEIPMAKSAFVRKGDDVIEKTKDLKYPLFTKPVCEGSSFGMTKVERPEDLKTAYELAAKYNEDVLIEEFVDGFFVTVGVLECEGEPFATEILEIRPKNEWYDFEAKYKNGMSEFIVPAHLSDEVTARVKEVAVKAFVTAGCRGVSRVDFMMKDNIPYLLEINTSPGMTATSDLPAQAAAMGIDYDHLVLNILNSAGLNK